jgi:hypothetical protein
MRYLKAVIIGLMLLFTHAVLAAPCPHKTGMENTVRGMIVNLDRKEGTGMLREEQTNRLVPFRFTEDSREKRGAIPRKGAVVEFTYHMKEHKVTAVD